MSLRIALFGQFGVGNFGNEGSLAAMLAFLRRARPDAELTVICADPARVSVEHKVNAIAFGAEAPRGLLGALNKLLLKTPHRFFNLVHAYRAARFDVMIVPGTGILDDFATTPFGAPYALWRWCWAARLNRAKLAFVSIGAGPIRNKLSRWFFFGAARGAAYRSYRDQQSKDFMLAHNFPASSDPIYPDLAFSLSSPKVASTDAGALRVGVGLMRYVGWSGDPAQGEAIYAGYIAKMVRFTNWLLDQGHGVRLIMGETIDQRAVDDVIAALGVRGKRVAAEPSSSLSDVLAQISETDVVVATRFHNVVAALKLGRPTLSISYAKKNDVLLESMGLGGFAQHIEALDVDRLIAQFETLAVDRVRYAAGVDAARRQIETRLAEQEAILLRDLLAEQPATERRAIATVAP